VLALECGREIVGIRGLDFRYAIRLRRPFAEVDQLAALRAKRPPARLGRPFHLAPALRTGDDVWGWHDGSPKKFNDD